MENYRQYRHEIASRLRAFSVSDMKVKDVYVKKDVRTSNLEKYLTNLKAEIVDLGYVLSDASEVKLVKGSGGEASYIHAPFEATKTRKQTRKIARSTVYRLASVAVIGLFVLLVNSTAGLLFIGLGELAVAYWFQREVLSKRTLEKEAAVSSRMWLLLEGKVNPLLAPETAGEGIREQNRPVSELTLHVAGESAIDKHNLQVEIARLVERMSKGNGSSEFLAGNVLE